MDIKELDLVDPETHWYYQSKLRAVSQAIRRVGWTGGNILDIGAGSGFFSESLISNHPDVRSVCVDPHYADNELGTVGQLHFMRQADGAIKAESSLLLFMDVLEHVPDDQALLNEYVEDATPGTLVVITVPAFTSMWSAHDVFLEHYRRYRRSEVESLVASSGLTLLHSQYLFGSLFPPLWVYRRCRRGSQPKSDMAPVSDWVNGGLKRYFAKEHSLGWNPICGLSVLVVARVRR